MTRQHCCSRHRVERWTAAALTGYLGLLAVAVAGFGSLFAWTAVRDGDPWAALGAVATLTAATCFAWLTRRLIRLGRATSGPCGHHDRRPDEFDTFAVVGGMLDGAIYTRSTRSRWGDKAVAVFLVCCGLFLFASGVSQSHWGGVAAALVMGPCWLIVSLYAFFGTQYVPVIDEQVVNAISDLEEAYRSDLGGTR